MSITLDAVTLPLLAGSVLSVVFMFVPGLKTWYERQESTRKATVMAIAVSIVALAIVALDCFQIVSSVGCSKDSLVDFLVNVLGVALVTLASNQSTYLITKSSQKGRDGG